MTETPRLCRTCRWWEQAFTVLTDFEPDAFVWLGHCEPERMMGVWPQLHTGAVRCGLTDENYSCREWKEQTDELV